MKFLVIPSNRPDNLREFFAAWQGKGGWDSVVIIEDAPEHHKGNLDAPVGSTRYCWQNIDRILGDDAWIISREDSAIRSFGFLAAWHLGATSVLTLDDDCFPYYDGIKLDDDQGGATNLFDAHLSTFQSCPVWQYSVRDQRTRGIPYKNRGTLSGIKVNVGLWTNIGDWDSVQERPEGYFTPPFENRIIPYGVLTAMCGMNLCFLREAIPLMYFPLMGRGSPYRRFDDIWAGVIVKTIMDKLGWKMSVGEPFVEHRRASDPEVNRIKEKPGIEANEWFWEEIVKAADGWRRNNPTDYVHRLGHELIHHNKNYMAQLGRALQVWAGLFDKKLEF